MSISDEELSEFETLCKNVTLGHWEQSPYERAMIMLPYGYIEITEHFDEPKTNPVPDIQFIAAARSMAPRLVDELKAYKAACEVMARALEDISYDVWCNSHGRSDPCDISMAKKALESDAVRKVLK